ncbi:hypothetical protein [Chroococcidiopsis sp. SAG 2025]|uniref:hypothetical protein n=1 Tax=Chroococcidiopsis sp. SAG 2025 TaxID=171389 RepID=UPI00293715E6|nr:hypothetical protein [Chroococcidiopsis sp. SAG 2025]
MSQTRSVSGDRSSMMRNGLTLTPNRTFQLPFVLSLSLVAKILSAIDRLKSRRPQC